MSIAVAIAVAVALPATLMVSFILCVDKAWIFIVTARPSSSAWGWLP